MRTPAFALVTAALIMLTGCAVAGPEGCAGSFDAEVVPSADGAPSKIEAVEQWAASHPAPDDGWVETPSGASVGGWLVTTVEVADGGWVVESQRCDID